MYRPKMLHRVPLGQGIHNVCMGSELFNVVKYACACSVGLRYKTGTLGISGRWLDWLLANTHELR